MTGVLTDDDLAAIKARADAASDGPWFSSAEDIYHNDFDAEDGRPIQSLVGGVEAGFDEDATFIAHARDDVPALLAQIDAEATRIATLEAQRAAEVIDWFDSMDGVPPHLMDDARKHFGVTP